MKRNYIPLIPPIAKSPFDMTPEEAGLYFKWFVNHVDERAEYVREKAANGLGIPISVFDFTIKSMQPLWKWFLSVMEVVKSAPITSHAVSKKQAFLDLIAQGCGKELSVFSIYVLRDIAMYIGKVFVRYEAINWIYRTKPKRYVFINSPLLAGFIDTQYEPPFHAEFDPVQITMALAQKSFKKKQNEDDPYNLLKRWEDTVPISHG